MNIITKLIFLITRISSLASRPILLILIANDNVLEADVMALIFSAVASSFVVLTNNNHRDFYPDFIKDNTELTGNKRFLRYAKSQFIHIAIFLPIVGVVALFWVAFSVKLALVVMIFVLIEKFFDEELRLLVYRQKFIHWCIGLAFKLLLPFFFYYVLSLYLSYHSHLIYFYLSIVSIFAYVIYTKKLHYFYRFFRDLSALNNYGVRIYISEYISRYSLFQLWAFISANLVLIDRFFVNKLGESGDLAMYTYLAMIANAVLILHRVLYVEERRHSLISFDSLSTAMFNYKNLSYPFVLAVSVFIAVVLMSIAGLIELKGSYFLISMLLLAGYFNAVSSILIEWCFWHGRVSKLIAIDMFVLCIASFSMYAMPEINSVATILAGVLAIRLLSLLVYSNSIRLG